jgi:hypothetical protein
MVVSPTPTRRWPAVAGLIALLALLVVCGVLALVSFNTLDPDVRAERARQQARAAMLDDQLRDLDVKVAAAWRVLPLLLVCAGATVGFVVIWRRWAAPTSIASHYTVKALQAEHQHPAVPQSLTYSPHYSHRGELAAPPALDAIVRDVEGVPTFAQLLDRGRIAPGKPLLLGYEQVDGQELAGSWLDLYSTAVSGMPGSGKTTSQRFLACQTALQGAQFAICDPHAGATDDSLASTLAPLSSAFLCEPASRDKDILEVVRTVANIGRRRVEGKDSSTRPLILWVDELTSLLGRSSVAEPLAELLEQVAQEYRKRGVFVCASGQIWTAARTSSELRDSFASVICHRMKRAQARLLIPTEEAEQVERLPIGSAVLWRTSGVTTVIQVPNTTAADCVRVGGLLATPRLLNQPSGSHSEASLKPLSMPNGSHLEANTEANPERLHSAPIRAEAARVAQMFVDGMNPADIVRELRGVKSNEGGKYQAALSEVLNLLREGMR